MAKQIFVNLPVKDLKKSIDFFTKLGFTFNPKFTDQNATCMIIGENIFVMLILEQFFRTFIPGKEIADAGTTKETLIALALENKEKVNEMAEKALAARNVPAREAKDPGWMYERPIQDI